MTERLSGGDGEKRVFRDSAVNNLAEFFERFRQLSVRSNPDLDALIDQAQRIVQGSEPQNLRDNQSLRQHVTTQLSRVQASIDGMLVDQPRRPGMKQKEVTVACPIRHHLAQYARTASANYRRNSHADFELRKIPQMQGKISPV